MSRIRDGCAASRVQRLEYSERPAPAGSSALPSTASTTLLLAVPLPPVQLEISSFWPDQRTIQITVVGEVDIRTGEKLAAAIASALAEHPERLIVDLAGVSFGDSHLVHALDLALGERSRGRALDLRLAGARPQIVRLLTLCGLAGLASTPGSAYER